MKHNGHNPEHNHQEQNLQQGDEFVIYSLLLDIFYYCQTVWLEFTAPSSHIYALVKSLA